MYLKKRVCRKISAVMAAALMVGNTMSAGAAPVSGGDGAASPTTVETAGYRAEIHLDSGTVLLSCNSDHTKDWNTADGMSPGATMLMDGNDQVRTAAMTVDGAFDNEDGKGGAAGIRMSGEVAGVKSWFFFDSEVVCLGAGLESSAEGTDRIINVVDNVAADQSLKIGLTNPNNGFRGAVAATNTGGQWVSAKDTATQQTHTRNWLSASGLAANGDVQPLEWRYIFSDTLKNSNVYCRFPTADGAVSRFELWAEPVKGAYQYTLGAGGNQKALPNNTIEAENRVLSNTKDLQAAESQVEGLMAVNKWTAGAEEVSGAVADLSLNQPVSVFIRKSEAGDKATVIVSKLTTDASSSINVTADLLAESVGSISDPGAVTRSEVETGKLILTLDAAKMSGPVTVEVNLKKPEYVTGDTITMVRGDVVNLSKPDELSGDVTWSAKFMKKDGTYIRNVGSSKIKRELKDGEVDGTRTAGDTLADHLINVKVLSNGDVTLTAKEKGDLVVVAKDASGKEKVYPTKILYEDPANLPQVTDADYAKIRQTWKESLIGTDIASAEGGAEILQAIDQEAKDIWDAYGYKGLDSCPDVPWPGDLGAAGNIDVVYQDDAVEFRPAFKKVLAMAKAYSTEGSQYYGNQEMFSDMIHAMDYLCTVCYTPKSQTDNWWTWEIGMPKDLIPILILLYDELTPEQIMTYTEALYFFQPDPYHEGALGTGSTHAQGYRIAQGANIIDCSTTAVGLGALRKDNELVYLGMLASSQTFVIQQVADSEALPLNGYTSGFYADGSYLDHSHVPYIGAYGIEFMKGGVKIPSLIGGTPWQYPDEVRQNLEYYIVEGFGNSIYRGMMLDNLKGRSVSRPASSNRAAGREAMAITLQMVDSLSEEARETVLSAMKYWLESDPGFIDSLVGVENMPIKRKAQEILQDDSIESYVPSMHRSFPLMDRAVHRRDSYLFALSMYSERIQNTEIMNDENKFGWHQGNGMTYIYDDDDQYTDNYWNTVNPLRLPGTTVVPMNIGNGVPDSSGFLQGGDFRSDQSWVGGSAIGNYGISGMAFSGVIGGKGKSADSSEVAYAPNLRGKKSWFMFDDEIVCLGAGITNTGMDLPVETTVENRKINEDGSNGLIIDGTAMELSTKAADLRDYVSGTADVTGTVAENVTWAHLEGNETAGTGYYFPYENTELNVRKARTTGNWSDVGTTEGESTQNYMEMWLDHGVNPQDASYGYVLLPGMTADETADYAQAPKVVILTNTAKAQAVHHEELGITGINFWEDEETRAGDVTCDRKASVMLREEEDGLLAVAVSDPTMKNKGTIQVTLHRPVVSEEVLDDNVSCEIQEDGSAVLTFQMKGTNGASSVAKVQLAASIRPSAASMRPGESRIFEVRDYLGGVGQVTWSVKGCDGSLAAGTVIDDDGVLLIDPTEENKALTVTAETESGLTLNASVSLGGDVVITELPEDMKKVELKVDQAFKVMEELGVDDPETEKAVKAAIVSAENSESGKLVEYMMSSLLKLAQLYIEVRDAIGIPIDERVEPRGKSVEGLHPVARGMVLNISPDYKDQPSTAVLVISGEDAEVLQSYASATPSNAARKAKASTAPKATPSVASKEEETVTRTWSETVSALAKASRDGITDGETEKILGKPAVSESIFRFRLELFWEKENEEDWSNLDQKIPYEVTIDLPERIDIDQTILAAVTDEEGKEYPLSFEIDKENQKLIFFAEREGTMILANEEVTEKPDPEKPEPEKPDPEKPEPEKPDPEKPEPEKPEPEKPEPEKPEPEKPEPEKPEPEKPEPEKPAQDSDGDDSDHSDSGIGWSRFNNQWQYRRVDGRFASNCWENINGQWYSFDARGNMRTGWYFENQDGCWYYLKPDGSMATGWLEIGGKWYYFNLSATGTTGWGYHDGVWSCETSLGEGMPQGALYQSRLTPDGYRVDEQGSWIE